MYPSRFRYFRPQTLTEALELIGEHGDDARPLAGGQSLIPLMKLRIVHPSVVVDLNGLPGLDEISFENGHVTFGALVRHWQVADSREVSSRLRVLHEAASILGDTQVRSLGTVAGAAAEADPSGDWGAALLASGAEVICVSKAGSRTVPIEDFFVGYLESDLRPEELISEVRVPIPPDTGSGGAYAKLERRVGDFAVVAAAVRLTLDRTGTCTDVGIGLAGVDATPRKPAAVEEMLMGSTLDRETITQAQELIRESVDPIDDGRGPAWYKRDMAAVFFERALQRAIAAAGSDGEGG